jgi:hypothetical protein
MASDHLYTLAKTNMSVVTLALITSSIIIFGGIAIVIISQLRILHKRYNLLATKN